MKVIGLDLSLTSTGVACNLGWVDRIRVPDTAGRTFARLRAIRDRAIEFAAGADLVVVEGLAVASKTGKHLTRAGLWHLVMEAVDAHDIPWAEVAPNTLKKYATGNGQADKDTVFAAVIRRFPDVDVTGNDESDALVLAAMGARHLGVPMDQVPKVNQSAMTSVRWPEVSP